MTRYSFFSIFFFTFLLGPVAHASCRYEDDPALQAQQEECQSRPAMKWDCASNRCIADTKASVIDGEDIDAVEFRREFQACKDLPEIEQRHECFMNLAKKYASGHTTDDFKKFGGKEISMAAMNAIFAAYSLLIGKGAKGGSGLCPSRLAMMITSIGGLLYEAKMQFMTAKDLDLLEADYKKQALSENSFEAQTEALEFLKEREKQVEEWASERKKMYLLMSIGYGITGVLAIAEMAAPSFAKGCGYSQKDSPVPSDDPTVSAEALEGMEKVDGGGGTNFLALNSPVTVLIGAGVGTGLSIYLHQGAAKEEEKAKKNIKYLRALLAIFEDGMKGFCAEGRNDMSDPKCYCHLDDGSRNPNRTESQTCQNYWAGLDQNHHVAANEYGRTDYDNQHGLGCVMKNGQFDANCDCRKMIDDHGENACYKTPGNINELGALGHGLGVSQFAQDIESMANGQMAAGDLSLADLNRRAAAVRNIKSQLLNDLNKEREKNNLPKIEFRPDEMARDFLKRRSPELASTFAEMTTAPKMPGSPGLMGDVSMDAPQGVDFTGGKGLKSSSSETPDKKNYDIAGFNNRSPSGRGQVVDDFGGGFEYKNDDIVMRDEQSLWNIISRRYNTSGLRRLFPEDKLEKVVE